eukprot:GHVU01011413.1.p1 GENE.GHVU01011413.1~~GHVU01011413.1.p1  ORF type:complete len:214 (-),score=31.94 GHVU01011413.1:384-1025(-)
MKMDDSEDDCDSDDEFDLDDSSHHSEERETATSWLKERPRALDQSGVRRIVEDKVKILEESFPNIGRGRIRATLCKCKWSVPDASEALVRGLEDQPQSAEGVDSSAHDRLPHDDGHREEEEEDRHSNPQQTFECPITADTVRFEDTFCLPCQHRFSNKAWTTYLAAKNFQFGSEGTVLCRCMAERCREYLSDADVERFLDARQYEDYLRGVAR